MNKSLPLHKLLIMVNKDKWAEIHNPDNYFNINPLDHDSLEEYQKTIED